MSAQNQKPTPAQLESRRQTILAAWKLLQVLLELLPSGQGNGSVAELAAVSGLSKNRTEEAIKFLRYWRAIWFYRRGGLSHSPLEIRFQPDFLALLLKTGASKAMSTLKAHKRQREAVAPWLPKERVTDTGRPVRDIVETL